MGSLIWLFLEGKKGKHNRQLWWPWNMHCAYPARYRSLPGFPGIQACLPWNKRCFALFLSVMDNTQAPVSETRQVVAWWGQQPLVDRHAAGRGGGAAASYRGRYCQSLARWLQSSMFVLKKKHSPMRRNSSSTGYYHPYGLNIKKTQHPRNQLLIQTWKWIIKLTGNIGPCSPLHFPFIETQLFFGCCQG